MSHRAEPRHDHGRAGLNEQDLAGDPFRQFDQWFQETAAARLPEPTATRTGRPATRTGRPAARPVLLKAVDARGFVFYTNNRSRKGRELESNPRATLPFPWFALHRQVIVDGPVARIPRAEAEKYFHRRPPADQLAARTSAQSMPVASRSVLEQATQAVETRDAGRKVPLPPHWGGFRLAPETVEFWQGRPNRRHDRLRYRRQADRGWIVERLSP
jgi:pyridoxamine 5'-phosphate oxidase